MRSQPMRLARDTKKKKGAGEGGRPLFNMITEMKETAGEASNFLCVP